MISAPLPWVRRERHDTFCASLKVYNMRKCESIYGRTSTRDARARRTRDLGVTVDASCARFWAKPSRVILHDIQSGGFERETTRSEVRTDLQVLDVSWTSIVAFSDDPATDDDSFAFCNTNNLSCSGPPVSFRREPGIGHSEAHMTRLRVSESASVVNFKNRTILDGSTNESMFEMEWESW